MAWDRARDGDSEPRSLVTYAGATLGGVELSIIVPTHDRRELVAQLLRRLRALPGPAREVIVIDDGSRDGTANLLGAADNGVRVVRNETPRGFDALADAISLARGWLILQLDDDAYPAPETLSRVTEHFRHRGAALGLAALPFLDPDTDRPTLALAFPDLPDGVEYGPTSGFFAGAVAVRREVAQTVGLCPPGYMLYETEPAALIEVLDAGWEADFLPAAPVYHLWAGRRRAMTFASAYLPLRNDLVTIKRYYRGFRRTEMLVGRYLTGLVHLAAVGRPLASLQAMRDANRLLTTLPKKSVDPAVLRRVYRCFTGLTLTTLLHPINFRRLAWFLGLLPIDQIG